MTDESGFLRRWSRRKLADRQATKGDHEVPAPETPAEDRPAVGQAAGNDPSAAAAESESPAEAPDLPDIDSLTAESDFSPFMGQGVPAEIRNRALRRLWRLNPRFSVLDGLNDYDGDFTDSATVVAGLKSVYKVGRGIVEKVAPDESAEGSDTAPTAVETGDAAADDESVADTGRVDDRPVVGRSGNENS